MPVMYESQPQPGRYMLARADARDLRFLSDDSIHLVVTSPPYLDVTNFEEDQWLRLWFLGNDPEPTYRRISGDDRHRQASNYWNFLTEAWEGLASLMARRAVIVCRIGGKGLSVSELTKSMEKSGARGTSRSRLPK